MSTELQTHQENRSRLWISVLDDEFNPETDIAIAPWCVTDKEEQFPDWETWKFAKPFPNSANIPAHNVDINSFSAYLLEQLKTEKNTEHGVEYGTEYWRILAMHWIVDLVNFAWYRWQEITVTLNQFQSRNLTCVVLPDDVEWRFNGYGDFNATTIYNVDFTTWVSSKILRMLAPSNVTLIERDISDTIAPTQVPHIKPATSTFRKILRQLRAAANSERCVIGSIGNEYSLGKKLKSIATEKMLGGFLALLPVKSAVQIPRNKEVVIPDRFPAQFVNLVRDLMQLTAPKTLGEDYRSYRAKAVETTFKPGKLTIQIPAFHLNPVKQFRIAHAVDAGEHLIGYQHGGSYGAVSVLQVPPETEYKSFAFITWGWHRHSDYDGNFIRLPSSQLASWRNARKPTSGRGLFVAQAIRFLPGRISFEGDIYNRTWSRNERLKFFKALPEQVMREINYRPYDTLPSSQRDTQFFKERLDVLNIAKDNFHTEMVAAKVVMIDHPGTTFFQAIAANIPVVGYWSKDAYPINPQAKATFDALKNAGIIFEYGENAAQHIANIWDDIDEWWESPTVIMAKEQFKDNYAYTERFWFVTWMKKLWKL